MTKFMKFEAISFFILRALGYICGIVGVLGVFGFAGSFECEVITLNQFVVYELHAFCLIGLSWFLYYVRGLLAHDIFRRERLMKKQSKV